MDATRAARALATVTTALVSERDVHTGLLAVMDGACDALDGQEAAILVLVGGRLELLASTSHRTADLEVHQLQLEEGPCLDAVQAQSTVTDAGESELSRRWPRVAPLMLAADLRAVLASAVVWHGTTLGGLNVFRREPQPFTSAEQGMAAAFAGLCASHLLHAGDLDEQEVRRRLDGSLNDRVVIEQAKGVLAEQRGGTMADAYDELVRLAREQHETVTGTARRLLDEAQHPPR